MGMTRDKVEFAFLMARHVPLASFGDVERLLRYGATLKGIAEQRCNGPDYKYCTSERERNELTKRWQAYQDSLPTKQEKIESCVRMLCLDMDCKAIFQGDPRGATVKIQVPDGYTNDWGREGICVPTS